MVKFSQICSPTLFLLIVLLFLIYPHFLHYEYTGATIIDKEFGDLYNFKGKEDSHSVFLSQLTPKTEEFGKDLPSFKRTNDFHHNNLLHCFNIFKV